MVLLEQRGEVLPSAGNLPRLLLWRQPLDGSGPPVSLGIIGDYAVQSAVHGPSGRIVSGTYREQSDVLFPVEPTVRQRPLRSPCARMTASSPCCRSTRIRPGAGCRSLPTDATRSPPRRPAPQRPAAARNFQIAHATIHRPPNSRHPSRSSPTMAAVSLRRRPSSLTTDDSACVRTESTLPAPS